MDQPQPRDFGQFLDTCLQELNPRQQAYVAQWGIDGCERWEVDQAAYGAKHMRMRLTEKGWQGDFEDAWKMTALAVKLLGADAAYRGPAGPMDVFMVIRDLKNAEEPLHDSH
jgi:hypothetical protein